MENGNDDVNDKGLCKCVHWVIV